MIAERLLLALSRPVSHADYEGGTTAPGNREPLKQLKHAFPDLADRLSGKTVVDFGCGEGYQAAEMAVEFGCTVYGLDTNERTLWHARQRHGSAVKFVSELPEGLKADVVVSQDAMEHFSDPGEALAAMHGMLKPGGTVLMVFGPTWYSPYGSHMHFFCKVPWLNLLFPERAVMRVRARYRDDGATRYEEVESGLNRMTVAKFERLVAASGFTVDRIEYRCVKGLRFLARLPVLRELFVNHIRCVLRA